MGQQRLPSDGEGGSLETVGRGATWFMHSDRRPLCGFHPEERNLKSLSLVPACGEVPSQRANCDGCWGGTRPGLQASRTQQPSLEGAGPRPPRLWGPHRVSPAAPPPAHAGLSTGHMTATSLHGAKGRTRWVPRGGHHCAWACRWVSTPVFHAGFPGEAEATLR